MARVDYTGVPEVSPQSGVPDDYQHIEANPGAFGAQIAQGAEKLGAAGLDLAKFYGQVAADDATNQWRGSADKLLYGDPNTIDPETGQPDTGFFGKTGADAMRARAGVAQQLDELQQEHSSTLTPAARQQFENETRRYRFQFDSMISEHDDKGQKEWSLQTNETSAQIALNGMARTPDSDAAVNVAREQVRNAFVKTAQIQYGHGPEVVQGAILKADQAVAKTQVESLLATNPGRAEQVFNTNRGLLSSMPDYDALSDRVKNRATEAQLGPDSQSFLSRYTPGGGSSPNNIGNVKTPDGAKTGALQFQQPQTPEDGVALTVGTLRRSYRGMSLAQIGQKWEGTSPQHIADWVRNTSQASGIAPNAVPDLNDPQQLHALVRGIGVAEKSAHDRAAFTPDVIDRGIQKATGAARPATPQNVADYYRSNYSQIVQDADAEAERLRPGDGVFADRFRARVERNMGDYIRQQELSYKADSDTVFQAFNGDLTKGHMPTTIDEMRAINPQVGAAWDRFQADNPQGALAVETRLMTANSRGKAAGYGTDFYRMLRQVLAPSDDPNYIHDASKLLSYVQPGEYGPLSNTGFAQLKAIMDVRGTPQGEAFATSLRSFLDAAHNQISGSDPRTGLLDHKGDERFSKFLPDAMAKIEAGLKAGKTPGQLFNPESKEYVGDSIYSYTRKPSDRINDMMFDAQNRMQYGKGLKALTPQPLSPAQRAAVEKLSKSVSPKAAADLAGLQEAVRTHRMTRQQAIDQATARGLIAQPAPEVPLPSGQ